MAFRGLRSVPMWPWSEVSRNGKGSEFHDWSAFFIVNLEQGSRTRGEYDNHRMGRGQEDEASGREDRVACVPAAGSDAELARLLPSITMQVFLLLWPCHPGVLGRCPRLRGSSCPSCRAPVDCPGSRHAEWSMVRRDPLLPRRPTLNCPTEREDVLQSPKPGEFPSPLVPH